LTRARDFRWEEIAQRVVAFYEQTIRNCGKIPPGPPVVKKSDEKPNGVS